ncbi:flippase-like domain-containing protein [Candidatus Woesearchaeota archaeon]|nr:flippase-like domain-containing protein [Candidatus Woesearchaeota archaeon]
MINFKEIFHEILNIKGDLWIAFLLAAVVVISNIVILALRYKIILGFLGEKINLFYSFNISCSAQFISLISPFKVGLIVTKPFITKAVSQISFKKSTLASVFEQSYDITWEIIILPLLIYIIGKEYFNGTVLSNIAIFVILLVGGILIIINLKRVIGVLWRIKFLVPKFIRDFLKRKNVSKENILKWIKKSKSYLANKKMFIIITIITSIVLILSPLNLKIYLIYFGYNIPYHLVLAGFWASAIIGRLSGLPMGVGARDLSLGAILIALGVTLPDSIKIVIFVRLTIIITVTLFGSLFLGYNSRKIKDFWEIIKKKKTSEI